MKQHIGIIGLGIMGGAMAQALIDAGHRVSGYDVQPAARQRLKKAGGHSLSSCAKVARSVDIVVTSLPSVAALDAVVQEIKQVPGMENYAVRSMQEYLSMMTPDNLPGFETAIHVVIGVAVTIGFLVIFQSMYTAVTERTREIGILKSLGASKFYIVDAVLRETALLAVIGVIAGIIISMITRRVIVFEKPVLRLFWSNEWVLRATVIAIVGALAGALYPAFKAAQKDPIDALAYE